ncbi:MAG: DegV family protein [bacterium]|jgi:DegV family protein with EDD domain
MPKVKIVTDSTSDITPELAAAYGIEVLPLTVTVDGQDYRDGVDIHPEQFYSLQKTARELPRTTQVTLAQLKECFARLVEDGSHVISIHLSGALSGTVGAAGLAAEQLDRSKVTVVDSRSISLGQGFMVLEAANLARAGHAAGEIVARVLELRAQMETIFTVSTLEYLCKGGRIGRVPAALGTLLNIKPLIRVEDGVYTSFGKVRTLSQAIEKFVAFARQKAGNSPLRIAVGHGAAPEAALKLREAVQAALHAHEEIHFFQVGPAIGVHTGPGTLGMAFYPVQP